MIDTTLKTWMLVSELRLRDQHMGPWWSYWGQIGKEATLNNRQLTPQDYYGSLLLHMLNGGEIEPLIVGPWVYGEPGQLYVHDGHHRFAIARSLGWQNISVVPAGDEYVNGPAWNPSP